MSDDLEFKAEEFLKLPVGQRVKLCRTMTEHANALAQKASPKYRAYYLEIAKQWLTLADEMERSINPKKG
ncbi:MAG TPA: hypothetical protein VEU06_08330 [Micropepsaceae bacterium]|nr:hypothetical protein [Micropepsaceae bacterium]